VSFLDAILGRDKPVKSKLDQLFGLSTAELTLATEFNLSPTGYAAVAFRPVSSGDFTQLRSEITALLQASTKDSPLSWQETTDSYGYAWVILHAQEFANLVASIHMISRELQDAGFGEQLLATVFQFSGQDGRKVYWIYNYKRGAFYPFVPTAGQNRDNPLELRLSSIMGRELAMEQDLTRWYPLWGIPLAQ
jgi:hypothetical protein